MAAQTTASAIPAQNDRLQVFLHAMLFVAGFSLVFVVGWGGSVTIVGQFFGAYKRVIAQIGGAVVILFGLATLGAIRLPWFYADTRASCTRPAPVADENCSPTTSLASASANCVPSLV